jgi:hypothetical protein
VARGETDEQIEELRRDRRRALRADNSRKAKKRRNGFRASGSPERAGEEGEHGELNHDESDSHARRATMLT